MFSREKMFPHWDGTLPQLFKKTIKAGREIIRIERLPENMIHLFITAGDLVFVEKLGVFFR